MHAAPHTPATNFRGARRSRRHRTRAARRSRPALRGTRGASHKMVHSMDALSAKWRDDPVRAALEKKQGREAKAENRRVANEKAAEILKSQLEQANSSKNRRALDDAGEDEDENYKKLLEKQRKRLMEGASDSDSGSSNISVFARTAHGALPHRAHPSPRCTAECMHHAWRRSSTRSCPSARSAT